jgi:hypothetical protein
MVAGRNGPAAVTGTGPGDCRPDQGWAGVGTTPYHHHHRPATKLSVPWSNASVQCFERHVTAKAY